MSIKQPVELLEEQLETYQEAGIRFGEDGVRPEMEVWIRDWNREAELFQGGTARDRTAAREELERREIALKRRAEEEESAWKETNRLLTVERLIRDVVAEGLNHYGATAKLRAVVPRNWRQKANMPKMAKSVKAGNFSEPIHWNLAEVEDLRVRPDSNWGYAGVDTKAGKLVRPFLGIVLSEAYCEAKGIEGGGWHYHFLRTGFDVNETWQATLDIIDQAIQELEAQELEEREALFRRLARIGIVRSVLQHFDETGSVPLVPLPDEWLDGAAGDNQKSKPPGKGKRGNTRKYDPEVVEEVSREVVKAEPGRPWSNKELAEKVAEDERIKIGWDRLRRLDELKAVAAETRKRK